MTPVHTTDRLLPRISRAARYSRRTRRPRLPIRPRHCPRRRPIQHPLCARRRHNTRWSHSQIGSMELEGVPGLTERSHGHRATRTWVSLYHRADVEEVATATCGTLDARSLRAWHQRGEAAQAWRSARGATGSTSGAGDWQWCTGTHISTHDFSTHEFLRFTLLLWILSYWIMFTVRTDHVPTDHAATVCPTPSVQQHAPSARLASPLPVSSYANPMPIP